MFHFKLHHLGRTLGRWFWGRGWDCTDSLTYSPYTHLTPTPGLSWPSPSEDSPEVGVKPTIRSNRTLVIRILAWGHKQRVHQFQRQATLEKAVVGGKWSTFWDMLSLSCMKILNCHLDTIKSSDSWIWDVFPFFFFSSLISFNNILFSALKFCNSFY